MTTFTGTHSGTSTNRRTSAANSFPWLPTPDKSGSGNVIRLPHSRPRGCGNRSRNEKAPFRALPEDRTYRKRRGKQWAKWPDFWSPSDRGKFPRLTCC